MLSPDDSSYYNRKQVSGSPGGPIERDSVPDATAMVSVPGRGTKILHTRQPNNDNSKEKLKNKKFLKREK